MVGLARGGALAMEVGRAVHPHFLTVPAPVPAATVSTLPIKIRNTMLVRTVPRSGHCAELELLLLRLLERQSAAFLVLHQAPVWVPPKRIDLRRVGRISPQVGLAQRSHVRGGRGDGSTSKEALAAGVHVPALAVALTLPLQHVDLLLLLLGPVQCSGTKTRSTRCIPWIARCTFSGRESRVLIR